MLSFFRKSRKILGMNARNLEYIRPFNLASSKKIADDKLFSKKILKKNNIAVPELIAKIRNYEELENFDWQSLPSSFALKPNRGFGGEGIIVVYGKKKPRPTLIRKDDSSIQDGNDAWPASNALRSNADWRSDAGWVKADRSLITIEDLKNHIRNILAGSFSLSGTPDTAFFEERLTLLKLFKPYAFKGIPDIRVIVFNKVPVMAMLRLPTEESQGKANLSQGAIGVGIDLASGTTTTAVAGKHKIIEYVPGTRLLLSGIKIPFWKDILELAVKTQEISGLGYLGADVAIDKERGPVILELNARPGLAIQIANLDGLKKRLEKVSELKIKTVARGVRVGMDLFGGEIEEEMEEISGKKVIGTVEKIKLIGKDGKEVEVEAKIDTGAGYSSIDIELAKQLGFKDTVEAYEKINIDYDEIKNFSKSDRWNIFKNIPHIASTVIVHSSHGTSYRPTIRLIMTIEKVPLNTKVTLINRTHLKYPVIIGKKNLKNFLIDVTKIK